MDLTQIRYFLALAKTLNFTRAAEACHVSQPALTKSIQRLEEELGGALLRRERSHTQLTELGVAMHPLLQRTFDAATAARLGALQFHQADVCQLRIGIDRWVPPSVLVPVLREIGSRFPTLELSLRQADAETLNGWLVGSEVDLLITADREHLTDKATAWRIFQDRVVVLLAREHRLANGSPMPMEQLSGEIVVARGASSGPDARLHADLQLLLDPAPCVRHCGDGTETMWAMLRAGLGLALGPGLEAVPPEIVARPLDPPRHVEISVAAMAGRKLPQAADAFLRLTRARDWAVA
eukprot:gene2735-2774_t